MGQLTHWKPADEALVTAILARSNERIIAALESGADPNLEVGGYPVLCILAARAWAADSVEYLITHTDASLHAHSMHTSHTALMVAAGSGSEPGNLRIFKGLVEAPGARLHEHEHGEGATALDNAVRGLCPHQLLRLQELGAKPGPGARWLGMKPVTDQATVNSLIVLSRLTLNR